MKNILLVILILFTGLQLSAQKVVSISDSPTIPEKKSDEILTDRKAAPKEDLETFKANFIKKIQYNEEDIKELNFKMSFVVEKDGSLTNIKVIEDEFGIANDAVRAMKFMPKWEPAVEKGKVIRSVCTIPIKIKLD